MEDMRQPTSSDTPSPVLRPVDASAQRVPLDAVKQDARIVLVVYVVLLFLGVGTGYTVQAKHGAVGSQRRP